MSRHGGNSSRVLQAFSVRQSSRERNVERRRSRAAVKPPNGNAEFLRLVGEIRRDAGTGEDNDTNWQNVQHLIVPLKRRCFAVAGPVGFESDLRDLSIVSPTGGDAISAF